MEGLIPADYATFAQACSAKMTNYATAYCAESGAPMTERRKIAV